MTLLDKDMNMSFRSMVLECAIQIEKLITELIMLYLDVTDDNLKAFGNDSSNIAFSDKLNILLDIGVFRDKKKKALKIYNQCVLVSQIRNKVVHVYDCNTFISTMKMIKGGSDKLLPHLQENEDTGDEEMNLKIFC